MAQVLLGLGSNLGDKRTNLQEAVNAIKMLQNTEILAVSSIYETAPVGFENQEHFYNAVVLLETSFSPNAVLGICMGIEASMGRKRLMKNGPRIIDIDLLIYDKIKMDMSELTLPHPRMNERRFVLEPMKELFPTGRALGIFFGGKLDEVSAQQVKKLPIKLLITGGVN